ncbi:MAG: glycosyltransferase [Planctomycetaceae bacterium]|nr:glycosyltransferase [Planctomycetaceae bacterium]
MRVLFNTYPVAFDCPGGGEIQLLKSRAALERAGAEVLLYDVWQPQLRAVDVVHYFSVQGGSMNFCGHVKRLGLPLVISPILWITPENRQQVPWGEVHALLHSADRILPNSVAEREQLVEAFQVDPGKFTVTYNGIDASFAEPADPSQFCQHFAQPRPYLLCVGNIEPRKNQLRLIQASAGLDLDLILLGNVRDGHYWDACQAAAGAHVRYLGCLDHASPLLKSAYAGCSAFVLPSTCETPGLAALEAAAQGAPLAITEVGCTREYFGEFACYADPHDEASIRQAIVAALARPREARLRQRVLDSFTWDHTARALLTAYQQARDAVCGG